MHLPTARTASRHAPAARTGMACLCLLSLTLAPAHAQSKPPPVDCDNAMSTYEMNACALKDFEKADAALNAVYQRAIKSVPEMATEKPFDAKSWEEALRKSQRAWLAYRDAECKDHVPMHWTGGSGTNADVLGCMSTLTEARTKELKDRYEVE